MSEKYRKKKWQACVTFNEKEYAKVKLLAEKSNESIQKFLTRSYFSQKLNFVSNNKLEKIVKELEVVAHEFNRVAKIINGGYGASTAKEVFGLRETVEQTKKILDELHNAR